MKPSNPLFRVLFTAVALATATVVAHAAGDPPGFMSYQGYLVDANGAPLGMDGTGNPLPSNYDVTFSIFNAASGGDLLWREQQTITVDAGYFSVLLGEGTQVDSYPNPPLSSVFTGIDSDERYIGVAVRFEAGGSFSDILPRLRLLTSPYAFLASQARSLVDPDGNALVTAVPGNVTVAGGLTTTQPITVPSISANGANLTNLNASNISSGTLHHNRLPSIDASYIASGVLSVDRIPNLNASKITAGILAEARIPNLNASKINAGTFADARIPSSIPRLSASGQTFTSGLQVNNGLTINQAQMSVSTLSETLNLPFIGTVTYRYMLFDNNDPLMNGGYRWRVSGNNRMTLYASGQLSISGTLSEASDLHSKEALVPVDLPEALEGVLALPVYEWSYIEAPGVRHVGPMAQDFHAAFGLGMNDKSISPRDLAGVALAAVQGLNAKVEAQAAEIAENRARIAQLEAAVAALLEAVAHP